MRQEYIGQLGKDHVYQLIFRKQSAVKTDAVLVRKSVRHSMIAHLSQIVGRSRPMSASCVVFSFVRARSGFPGPWILKTRAEDWQQYHTTNESDTRRAASTIRR